MQTKNEYTAVIKQEAGWYIGWIEEIPGVNCQGKDLQTLKQTLTITLKEALEFNRRVSFLPTAKMRRKALFLCLI